MDARSQFLLFVAAYLGPVIARNSTTAWEGIKRARQIPNDIFTNRPEYTPEQLAFEFVAWTIGDASRPQWLSYTDTEQRLRHPRG